VGSFYGGSPRADRCVDIVATHAALAAKPVQFAAEPKKESWGSWWAEFRDPDGNTNGLGQD
jgi:hypothetical protein